MNSTTTAPQGQNALWNAMLDADMNVIFWSLMSQRFTRIDQAGKVIIALSSSGTVAAWSFWSSYPGVWKTLSVIAGLASVLHPILWSSEQQKRISRLVGTWRQIAVKYELLWEQDPDMSSPEAWKQFEKTKQNQGKIDETKMPASKKLVWKAYNQVLRKRGLVADKE